MLRFILISFLFALSLNASPLEKYYVDKYCKGTKEYILNDHTRIDCLTKEVAYEFDFAPKFYEAVGQSLYYSIKTNKQAGIYIIIRDLKDEKYIKRLKIICEKYNIDLKLIYDLKDR